MTVTVIANNKGGVCKSTTTAEIAAELARRGARVLAVDLDAQGNVTKLFGIRDALDARGTAAEVLGGEVSTSEATEPSPSVPGVDVLSGYVDVMDLDSLPPTRIRDLCRSEWTGWDHVVIDCPPALDRRTLAALVAAEQIVVPVRPAMFALEGLDEIEDALTERVAALSPGARVDWVVPTQIDQRRTYDREVLKVLADEHPGRVTGPVRFSSKVENAVTAYKPISHYAPRSPVAQDYIAAAAQIIG